MCFLFSYSRIAQKLLVVVSYKVFLLYVIINHTGICLFHTVDLDNFIGDLEQLCLMQSQELLRARKLLLSHHLGLREGGEGVHEVGVEERGVEGGPQLQVVSLAGFARVVGHRELRCD